MSIQDTAPRRRATNSADQPGTVSRRQLLASGAAVAAITTLPQLAAESRATVSPKGEGVQRAHLTDEQQRIATVLDRYGPELGSGR